MEKFNLDRVKPEESKKADEEKHHVRVMGMQQCLLVSLPLHVFYLRGQPLSPGCLSNLSSKHGSTPAPIRELYINLCTASQLC